MPPSERKYKRFDPPSVEPEDITNIVGMCLKSLSVGQPPKYENSDEGLLRFRQASIDYFEYIQRVNTDPNTENFLVPDIESWSCYLGITRATIGNYEKRNEAWSETIAQFKNAITACKKQLIFRQKIPSIIGIFDLVNNSGYQNTSAVQHQYVVEKTDNRLSIDDLPNLRLED